MDIANATCDERIFNRSGVETNIASRDASGVWWHLGFVKVDGGPHRFALPTRLGRPWQLKMESLWPDPHDVLARRFLLKDGELLETLEFDIERGADLEALHEDIEEAVWQYEVRNAMVEGYYCSQCGASKRDGGAHDKRCDILLMLGSLEKAMAHGRKSTQPTTSVDARVGESDTMMGMNKKDADRARAALPDAATGAVTGTVSTLPSNHIYDRDEKGVWRDIGYVMEDGTAGKHNVAGALAPPWQAHMESLWPNPYDVLSRRFFIEDEDMFSLLDSAIKANISYQNILKTLEDTAFSGPQESYVAAPGHTPSMSATCIQCAGREIDGHLPSCDLDALMRSVKRAVVRVENDAIRRELDNVGVPIPQIHKVVEQALQENWGLMRTVASVKEAAVKHGCAMGCAPFIIGLETTMSSWLNQIPPPSPHDLRMKAKDEAKRAAAATAQIPSSVAVPPSEHDLVHELAQKMRPANVEARVRKECEATGRSITTLDVLASDALRSNYAIWLKAREVEWDRRFKAYGTGAHASAVNGAATAYKKETADIALEVRRRGGWLGSIVTPADEQKDKDLGAIQSTYIQWIKAQCDESCRRLRKVAEEKPGNRVELVASREAWRFATKSWEERLRRDHSAWASPLSREQHSELEDILKTEERLFNELLAAAQIFSRLIETPELDNAAVDNAVPVEAIFVASGAGVTTQKEELTMAEPVKTINKETGLPVTSVATGPTEAPAVADEAAAVSGLRQFMGGMGTTLLAVGLEGAKLQLADGVVEMGHEFFQSLAETMASHGWLVKMPYIGARVRDKRILRITGSTAFLCAEMSFCVLLSQAIDRVESMPATVKKAAKTSLYAMMVAIAMRLIKRLGTPMVRKLFGFMAMLTQGAVVMNAERVDEKKVREILKKFEESGPPPEPVKVGAAGRTASEGGI